MIGSRPAMRAALFEGRCWSAYALSNELTKVVQNAMSESVPRKGLMFLIAARSYHKSIAPPKIMRIATRVIGESTVKASLFATIAEASKKNVGISKNTV